MSRQPNSKFLCDFCGAVLQLFPDILKSTWMEKPRQTIVVKLSWILVQLLAVWDLREGRVHSPNLVHGGVPYSLLAFVGTLYGVRKPAQFRTQPASWGSYHASGRHGPSGCSRAVAIAALAASEVGACSVRMQASCI